MNINEIWGIITFVALSSCLPNCVPPINCDDAVHFTKSSDFNKMSAQKMIKLDFFFSHNSSYQLLLTRCQNKFVLPAAKPLSAG